MPHFRPEKEYDILPLMLLLLETLPIGINTVAVVCLAVVSLYAEDDGAPGFLSSLGLIDDRCVLRPFDLAENRSQVPLKFRGMVAIAT